MDNIAETIDNIFAIFIVGIIVVGVIGLVLSALLVIYLLVSDMGLIVFIVPMIIFLIGYITVYLSGSD